jgi:glycosyltransferase involved in cell wall biosynthesis
VTDALVIIPALNEERTIAGVIQSIRKAVPDIDVIVISDGSTDQTAALARAAGVHVVSLPVNLGIGGAMQTGYRYAERHGYQYAVQIDADGQHDPRDLPLLLAQARRGDADMILGSRFVVPTGYKLSHVRRAVMRLLSAMIRLAIGYSIKDTTSGFRVVNRRAIALFARHYPQDYPETEVLVLLHRYRMRVHEVPVEMRQRVAGRSSISWLQAPWYTFKVALAIVLEVLRARPLKGETRL